MQDFVLRKIYDLLPYLDLGSCRLVCRLFHRALSDDYWRHRIRWEIGGSPTLASTRLTYLDLILEEPDPELLLEALRKRDQELLQRHVRAQRRRRTAVLPHLVTWATRNLGNLAFFRSVVDNQQPPGWAYLTYLHYAVQGAIEGEHLLLLMELFDGDYERCQQICLYYARLGRDDLAHDLTKRFWKNAH